MPKILIPGLGDTIELEEDWVFRLYDEIRNGKLQEATSLYPPYRDRVGHSRSWEDLAVSERELETLKSGWVCKPFEGQVRHLCWLGDWHHEMIFRAGTQLTIDRYYIRRGCAEYDSVTFRTKLWVSKPGDKLFTASRKFKSLRFWAKLSDVNDMVAKKVTPS